MSGKLFKEELIETVETCESLLAAFCGQGEQSLLAQKRCKMLLKLLRQTDTDLDDYIELDFANDRILK